MKTTAIIPAAGNSTRMGRNESKLFLMLGNMPVLAHTLRAFDNAQNVDEVIISAREEDILLIWDIISEFGIRKVSKIVNGGETRTASVLAALNEVADDMDFVAVHDGARPLVTPQLIDLAISESSSFDAVTLGVPVKDTIKRVGVNNIIVETLPRDELYHIQTPQVFRADIIRLAHIRAESMGIDTTDDCGLVEMLGIEVRVVQGDYRNIKITTVEDLAIAETLI